MIIFCNEKESEGRDETLGGGGGRRESLFPTSERHHNSFSSSSSLFLLVSFLVRSEFARRRYILMSGIPINRTPPRDDFALLAGGGERESEGDHQETIIDAIGAEVFNVVVPVAACIAVTSSLVQVLNPNGASGSAGVSWASAAYKEKVKKLGFFSSDLSHASHFSFAHALDPHQTSTPRPPLSLFK